jgi:hypothetical protein
MVANQMLLVPRVLFHALIIFDTLKNHLTKAVKVRDVGHLRVEQLGHQRTSSTLIVNLNIKLVC